MGKPDDIPQDVWDAAKFALFGWIPDDLAGRMTTKDIVHLSRCARAIMAERERCGIIVDELADRAGKDRHDKLILTIAARAVRRGRNLTGAEQIANIRAFLDEQPT